MSSKTLKTETTPAVDDASVANFLGIRVLTPLEEMAVAGAVQGDHHDHDGFGHNHDHAA